MPLLEDQPVEPLWRQRLVPCLQVAGLLLTGWVMWRSTLGLQWVRVPLPWLILRAAVYAVTACLAGAAITVAALSGRLAVGARRRHPGHLPRLLGRRVVRSLRDPADPAFAGRRHPGADPGGQRHPPALHPVARPTAAAGDSARHRTVRQRATPRPQFLSRIRPRICRLRHPANRRLRGAAASSRPGRLLASPPAPPWPPSSRWPPAASNPSRPRACRAPSWDSR